MREGHIIMGGKERRGRMMFGKAIAWATFQVLRALSLEESRWALTDPLVENPLEEPA